MLFLMFILIGAVVFLTFSAIGANREVKQWRKLENNQAARVHALELQVNNLIMEQFELDKFRQQPGMETVSATFAKKYLELEAENKKLHLEAGNLRLEAAKYMDLYRFERYKPRQINR